MTYEINGQHLYLDGRLKGKLDNIKKIMARDWDAVFLIDGIEGCGKSTLSFACGWYISDGKMTIKNIAEGTADAKEKLEHLPDKSVLIIDEGGLSFSSKEVMKKEQVELVKILNVIRQKCMCLIIVAPSFFELNKYISVERSRFLLHVYTGKDLARGRFSYFSTKKKRRLYAFGKKNFNSYAKPKSDFVGRFTKFEPFGKEYIELKKKSLFNSFHKKKELTKEERNKVLKPVIQKAEQLGIIDNKEKWAKAFEITTRTLLNWRKAVISLENSEETGNKN